MLVYLKVGESGDMQPEQSCLMRTCACPRRFKGLEQSVRTDIQTIKDSPLIPADIPVHGYIYEVRCSS